MSTRRVHLIWLGVVFLLPKPKSVMKGIDFENVYEIKKNTKFLKNIPTKKFVAFQPFVVT